MLPQHSLHRCGYEKECQQLQQEWNVPQKFCSYCTYRFQDNRQNCWLVGLPALGSRTACSGLCRLQQVGDERNYHQNCRIKPLAVLHLCLKNLVAAFSFKDAVSPLPCQGAVTGCLAVCSSRQLEPSPLSPPLGSCQTLSLELH